MYYQYILPPHILKAIAANSPDSELRRRALNALEQDHTHRSIRLLQSQRLSRQSRGQGLVATNTQVQRTVYDAHDTMNLPGDVVRTENASPGSDPAVNEAYDGLGWTHAFYLQIYSRNSIDNEGLPLLATVHYSQNYDNAFWDGTRMIFGDGDQHFFNRFTLALDVIGHELTHGVTAYEANLIYAGQAGALNESISDVFGSMIKQYALKQRVEQADWLIGATIFTAHVQGRALRDMAHPGTAYDDPVLGHDPQPDHMNNYVQTDEDNRGVHLNSGIPNRAFYLVAETLGGYSWERAGRIWYETVCDPHLRSTANFQAFAELTLQNAERLYGHGSHEWVAVREAWSTVGVLAAVPAAGVIYAHAGA